MVLGTAGGARPARARHTRSTTRSCSTGTSQRFPTLAARGCRTVSTVRAGRSTRAPSRGATARGSDPVRAQGVLGGVFYELHVGTFTAGGHSRRRAGSAGPPRRPWASTSSSSCRWPRFPAGGTGAMTAWRSTPWTTATAGPRALQRFVDACHTRGLGVCLDVVHNHLGASGNYLARFGPYFTSAHETPWGPAVNLDNEGSEQVRAFLVENAVRWFRDFHLDALRLDAVHELKDDSGRHYLAELSDVVAGLARRDRPPPGPRRGERPQRPGHGDPDERGWPRDDGAVGRRHPPRTARVPDGRAARLLRGLRRRWWARGDRATRACSPRC